LQRSREPVFNIPAVVTGTIVAIVLVHVVRTYVLNDLQDRAFIWEFAFVPARYDSSLARDALPGGLPARIWTFFTYAFIHGDWTHLGLNAVWLLAFGSAVARRFG